MPAVQIIHFDLPLFCEKTNWHTVWLYGAGWLATSCAARWACVVGVAGGWSGGIPATGMCTGASLEPEQVAQSIHCHAPLKLANLGSWLNSSAAASRPARRQHSQQAGGHRVRCRRVAGSRVYLSHRRAISQPVLVLLLLFDNDTPRTLRDHAGPAPGSSAGCLPNRY